MEKKALWKETTGWLYKSVLIYSLASIVGSVLAVIAAFATIGSALEGDIMGAAESAGALDTIAMIVNIVVLGGYALFFVYGGKFRDLLSGDDANAAGSLRNAHLILAIGTLLCILPIPFVEYIAAIINIIAWFMLLSAYGKLMNSTSLPELAAAGMKKLRKAMLLSVVGAIIAFIPFIGIVGSILALIAFFMTLKGWSMVAKSEI